MNGLEISKRFYLEYGEKAIAENFPEYKDRIAVGLVGEGSECLGYDDDISRDHDFDAGFCLWITGEDEKEIGFKLERLYANLPKEFMGLNVTPFRPPAATAAGL